MTIELDAPVRVPRPQWRRIPLLAAQLRISGVKLLCAGLLVVQLAWVFAVPPYGGIDEFDHAYRAASVARGHWVADATSATQRTGAWMLVPPAMVKVAHQECAPLKYTSASDCTGTMHGKYVRVASAAGRYNPLFYAVIGYPSLPFTGAAALYAMRVMTVLICWGLFVLAIAVLRRWARGPWPFVTAAVACTPVLVYSSSVAAPNGPEMMAALGLWSSLVGLASAPDSRNDRFLLTAATITGTVLVTLRSMGPLWCLLIALTVLVAVPMGPERRRALLTSARAHVCAGIVLAATLASVWWILSQGALTLRVTPTGPLSLASRIEHTSQALPLWLLQSVAAFPFREQASTTTVYICFLAVAGTLTTLAWRSATRRGRMGMLAVVAVAAAVPWLVTMQSIEKYGVAWQGRYGLPYSLGLLMLAGYALDRTGRPASWQLLGPALVLFSVAQTDSIVHVLDLERRTSLLADTSSWLQPSDTMIWVAGLVGAGVMLAGAALSGPLGAGPSELIVEAADSQRPSAARNGR